MKLPPAQLDNAACSATSHRTGVVARSPVGRRSSSSIAATTTKNGLTVSCELDANTYEKGVKVSDAEMAALSIEGDAFHPEWNYTIKPRPREAPG